MGCIPTVGYLWGFEAVVEGHDVISWIKRGKESKQFQLLDIFGILYNWFIELWQLIDLQIKLYKTNLLFYPFNAVLKFKLNAFWHNQKVNNY